MKRSQGFTIIELLISMAILLVVLGLAYNATTQFLRLRTDQDAITSTQAKLRRIVEVLGQDVRSAVLGAIIDTPFKSNHTQVSFALIKGSASGGTSGFKVLPFAKTDNYVSIIAGSSIPIARNDLVLMVNGDDGKAVLLPVTSSPLRYSQSGSLYKWKLEHSGCQNTITYTLNTLVFPIRTLGVRLRSTKKMLVLREDGNRWPLAFRITRFRVDYVYFNRSTGRYVLNPSGYNPSDRPPRKQFGNYTLSRLKLTLSAEQNSRGRTFTRTLVAPVDLSSTAYSGNNFLDFLREVIPCK